MDRQPSNTYNLHNEYCNDFNTYNILETSRNTYLSWFRNSVGKIRAIDVDYLEDVMDYGEFVADNY